MPRNANSWVQPLLLEGQRANPCECFPYRPATNLPHVMVSACFNQSSTKNGVDEILQHIQPHYVRQRVTLCWGRACDTARSPGKGVEKAGCQLGPWTEMKTVVINPKQLFFCGRIFHRVFRCVFRRAFRRTFRHTFRCTFRHIFRQACPCKLSCQGVSIHVTTKRLCQTRWHNIDNTEKHAIMEQGQTCLKHTACHIHCAWQPSWNTRVTLIALHPTKSSSKNHNQKKNN